ncbi:MAG: nucleotidyltransferase family protein [Patescibacteria group bacterium]
MKRNEPLEVCILCGGLGTRFRAVDPSIPKVLAPFNGIPFLSRLIEQFLRIGTTRIILCVGYKAEDIESYYRSSPYTKHLVYSKEDAPLGTGGALKQAETLLRGEYFFVANGDSYCPVNLLEVAQQHFMHKNTLATMVCSKCNERTDAGNVIIDERSKRIVAFREKENLPEAQWRNAGIYLFHKKALSLIPPDAKTSLEYDLFPALIGKGLYGFATSEQFIDIGTPERYSKALDYFSSTS